MPMAFNSNTTIPFMMQDQLMNSMNSRRSTFVVDQLARSASIASLGLTNLSVNSSPSDSVGSPNAFLSVSADTPFVSQRSMMNEGAILDTESLMNSSFGEFQQQNGLAEWMKIQNQHQSLDNNGMVGTKSADA